MLIENKKWTIRSKIIITESKTLRTISIRETYILALLSLKSPANSPKTKRRWRYQSYLTILRVSKRREPPATISHQRRSIFNTIINYAKTNNSSSSSSSNLQKTEQNRFQSSTLHYHLHHRCNALINLPWYRINH